MGRRVCAAGSEAEPEDTVDIRGLVDGISGADFVVCDGQKPEEKMKSCSRTQSAGAATAGGSACFRRFVLFTPRRLRLLLDSFAFIFLLTSGAKLLNVWNDALLLQVQDPVFSFLRSGQLHLIAGLLEAGLGFVILKRDFSPVVLAGLDKLFGWSEEQAWRVSLGILGYVLLGSCGALFWDKAMAISGKAAVRGLPRQEVGCRPLLRLPAPLLWFKRRIDGW